VKNPQHFHCDEHFRESGLEQVRAAVVAAVHDAPKKEYADRLVGWMRPMRVY
jgi:hypothetical protein